MHASYVFLSLLVVAGMNILIGAMALLPKDPKQFGSFCVPLTAALLVLSAPFGAAALV